MKTKKKCSKETQNVLNAILELNTLQKDASLFAIAGVFLKHCGDNIKGIRMEKTVKLKKSV